MIIITGAAGFIGSALVRKFNDEGVENLMLVDEFSSPAKNRNLTNKSYSSKVARDEFFDWLRKNHQHVDFVFHLGARTDTAEKDCAIFERLNVSYSKRLWQACADFQVPLIYASSAATYGNGQHGFDDSHETIQVLQPLNPYGQSKHDFDLWVLQQREKPPFWAGIKLFNVYGPNEYHKGFMASTVYHFFHQVQKKGKISLFRSHHPLFANGEQCRDFIYVKDVVEVLWRMYKQKARSGIYNLGTGRARSFNELAAAVSDAAGVHPGVDFIDTPESIRANYQYYTQAKMDKLHNGMNLPPFHSLEEGVSDYIRRYLSVSRYF